MSRNNIICIVALLLFSGCYTQRKAEKQVLKAQAHYEQVVAMNCGNWYPPKETTVTKTEYKPGLTTYHTDTVKVDCDTVKVSGESRIIRIPCPPQSERVDTFYTTKVETVENTARITALQDQYNGAHDQTVQLTQARNIWRWIALGCMGALVGYFVIKKLL